MVKTDSTRREITKGVVLVTTNPPVRRRPGGFFAPASMVGLCQKARHRFLSQVKRATKSRTEFKAGSSIDQNSQQAILFDCQNHAFEDIDVPRLLETKANTNVGFSDDDSPQRNPRLIQLVLKYSF